MGISLIMQNSVKGADILNSLPLSLTEVSYNDAVKSNFCIENSVQENEYVPLFWEKFHSCGIAGSREMLSVFRQSLLIRIVKYILRIVR